MAMKAAILAQAPRNRDIALPVTMIAGDADKTVSTDIHSRAFARVVPHARLIVLEGVGHMVQQAAPERVVVEIEAMIESIASPAGAAPYRA